MREKALEAFAAYARRYDVDNIGIKLKIAHTCRVADLAEKVGESVGVDPVFSWFLGLLHDIGRFEQMTRFHTFKDAESVDHAELGADILFRDGLIESFPGAFYSDPGTADGARSRLAVSETAVRLHNKLTLPEDLDEESALYCRILRDADKIDIFRVLTEPPYDERNRRITAGSKRGEVSPAGSDVMRCVHEHRCVPRTLKRTDFENLISQCCMGFELYYPISREIVKEQGYLDRLLNQQVYDRKMADQMETLRSELKRAWDET